jgi:ABC-type branched-subunit amino acid transport system ATPase component
MWEAVSPVLVGGGAQLLLPRRSDDAGSTPSTIALLSKVTKRFRGLVAVRDVSFELARGEIVGLIGPNGAGKTILVNLMAHTTQPDGGTFTFLARKLGRMSPSSHRTP